MNYSWSACLYDFMFLITSWAYHSHSNILSTAADRKVMFIFILTGWIPIEIVFISKELQDGRSVFRQTVIIQCFHAMGWAVKWRANCEQIKIKLFLLVLSCGLCPIRCPYPSCMFSVHIFIWMKIGMSKVNFHLIILMRSRVCLDSAYVYNISNFTPFQITLMTNKHNTAQRNHYFSLFLFVFPEQIALFLAQFNIYSVLFQTQPNSINCIWAV